MAILAQDNFIGSGPLQGRTTSWNPNHKWVKCYPDGLAPDGGAWKDLVASADGLRVSAALDGSYAGYRLVHVDTGLPVLTTEPFTVELVILLDAEFAWGMAGFNAGAALTPEYNPFDFIGYVGQLYGARVRCEGGEKANSSVNCSGTFDPVVGQWGAENLLRMEFGAGDFVSFKLNDTNYGSTSGYAGTEIAIMLAGAHVIRSIRVYEGSDPPPPDPDPDPSPLYFWRGVKNATQDSM